MELIDFKSSCKDCCDKTTKVEGCASGVSYILYVDDTAIPATLRYRNLQTGAETSTAPTNFVLGNCIDAMVNATEVLVGDTKPTAGTAAPTGSKLYYDTTTNKITSANVDGFWVDISDSSFSFSNILATGNKILTITDSEGNETDVYETITDVTAITNGFRYTNESGVNDDITFVINNTDPLNTKVEVKLNGTKVSEFPLYTVNNDIQINNAGSEWSFTDDQITILETNGDSQVLNFPYRVTVVANPDGSIDIKQNGVTIGTIPAPTADVAYSKMLFVDPINGLDTNTGSDNKMFKTLTKALTVADGSGFRIVLAAGTYTGNYTVTQANIDIVTVAGTDRGNTFINGTLTFAHTTSSSSLQGISVNNLVHSGGGSLYISDCQTNTSFSKTSNGYLEVLDSDVNGVSITGTGQAVFVGGKQAVFIVNNAGAIVTVNDSINLAVTTVTAGVLGVTDSIGFAGTPNGKAITASAGTTVLISNSQFYGSTGLITSLTLSGSYGIDDVQFDKVNSTLGTNLSTIGWFDKLGIINPATITTATKMLVRDANGIVSEQLLPVGGALWYSGTNTPTATGNTAASLGVTALPANYTNTTTGVIYYIDANGVAKAIEGRVTTSLLGRTGDGSGYVNPTMTSGTTTVDAFQLSDGTFAHVGQIKYPAHGLVKHAYYFGSATAPYYTVIPPTSGILQQVFYVIDENTIDIDVEQGVTIDLANYANVVYVNNTNVNNGTIYDTNNPPTTNNNALKGDVANLYIGSDGSLWVWNGTAYVTKPATNNTEWYLGATQVDAGGNKTSSISRSGWVFVGANKNATCPLDLENNAPGTAFMNVARYIATNQNVAGRTTMFTMGANQSAGNIADWRFYYAGPASGNNRSEFGFSGNVSPNLAMLYNGLNGIGTTAPVSNLDVNGSFGFNIRGAGSSTTQTDSDGTVVFTVIGAVYTLLAPTANNNRRVISVKNQTTGTISVVGHIDGVAGTTLTIPAKGSRILQSNGTSWWIIAGYL